MNAINRLIRAIQVKLMSNQQYIEHLRAKGVSIGSGCDIHKSADFGSEPFLIKIGNHTRITKGVQFITHDGGLWTLRNLGLVGKKDVKYGRIVIGDNVNIGWNVILMPNVTIGNNCVIGAGALVTKNVPDNTVWGGVPARQIETIEEYALKVRTETVPTFGMSEAEKKNYLFEHKPELFL